MNVRQAHDFCASLPAATRETKWGCHPTFCVGERMFALFTVEDDALVDVVRFKVDDDRFLELTDREGFTPAPYLARAKWVRLAGVRRLPDAEAKALLADSHRLIAAKLTATRRRALLGDAVAR